ncbi:aspartate-alanine antiporter [Bradyrhizobium liaoningense]|uniref:aspartate-alanine antiporter n=1 Tax=Bradyrhizobium liaoningense TaxID=43992 RepID=UPI001BA473CD|nr:aspartate-alanine antiporter [Bradyrhizobium liaoningense]MBR0818033.1 aspartate-alanine antiporter [Bradyrhizobium liaoningense]
MDWLVSTLRTYPELAIFLALAVGFWIGPLKVAGFSLGNVTGTLLAAVVIGQLAITISPNVKSVFFLLFLFAVGYGVGPQFFQGLAREGPKQIGFAVVVLAFCLIVPLICAKVAGLDLGYAAGLYAGSQTISASIGVATDQIMRLGLAADQAKALADKIPIGYAVTYIYGTIGSALVLAKLGPWLLGIDLPKACAEYEKQLGAGGVGEDVMSARRNWEVRAYRVEHDMPVVGRTVAQAEASSKGARLLVERIRRGNEILEWKPDLVLQVGDVVAVAGRRDQLVGLLSDRAEEVDDKALLDVPVEVTDVLVTNRDVSHKSLAELSGRPAAHGVFLRKITRNMVELPILPGTQIHRGDILTLVGSRSGVDAAAKDLGYADRPVEATDIAFLGAGILIGGLIGALSYKWDSIPISLSTSGGALLAGLILGWLRTIHPTFGRIPGPALALMNTLGLNVFIAVVGISSGPGFVAGLKEVGVSLFVWGIVATSLPLIIAVYLGHYVFKFHPAILFGACAGVRTTTAALGMIQEAARSKVPALGYGMPYAIGNTLLTIFGMIIVLMM